MKKAQGFEKIKQFSHKAKVRRSARHIVDLQESQALKLSPWFHLMAVKTSLDFTRLNWPGTLYMTPTDTRPRLVRAVR